MPSQEKFCNIAYNSVTESAANTLTFNKLETGISIYEKVGWLINRIEYYISTASAVFAADADGLKVGWSTSDGLTSWDESNSAWFDLMQFARVDYGTAGSGFVVEKPFVKDLSTLPGGGLLVPPNPLYLGAQGISLGAAQTVEARVFYTVIQLKQEEFWELVEMRRMIGT
jgi:hypothetical protein